MSSETSQLTTVQQTAEAWESIFRAQVGVMRRLQRDPEFKELTM